MPTNGTGQMVGRPISLTQAHDDALKRLATLAGTTPSGLVRDWIAASARAELRLELREPVPMKPGRRQMAWHLLTKPGKKARQYRLRLRKGPYRTRG